MYMVTLIGQGHTTSRFPKSGFEPRQSDSTEGKLVWKPAKGENAWKLLVEQEIEMKQ